MNNEFYRWLYVLISYIFRAYELGIFVYIFSSFIPSVRDTFLIKFLADICEPYLSLFRKILPPIANLDFSPMIALFCLGFIERLIYSLMFGVAFF